MLSNLLSTYANNTWVNAILPQDHKAAHMAFSWPQHCQPVVYRVKQIAHLLGRCGHDIGRRWVADPLKIADLCLLADAPKHSTVPRHEHCDGGARFACAACPPTSVQECLCVLGQIIVDDLHADEAVRGEGSDTHEDKLHGCKKQGSSGRLTGCFK